MVVVATVIQNNVVVGGGSIYNEFYRGTCHRSGMVVKAVVNQVVRGTVADR